MPDFRFLTFGFRFSFPDLLFPILWFRFPVPFFSSDYRFPTGLCISETRIAMSDFPKSFFPVFTSNNPIDRCVCFPAALDSQRFGSAAVCFVLFCSVRLRCSEKAKTRFAPSMSTRGKRKVNGQVQWVRCQNCGKWRALLRCMDASIFVGHGQVRYVLCAAALQ